MVEEHRLEHGGVVETAGVGQVHARQRPKIECLLLLDQLEQQRSVCAGSECRRQQQASTLELLGLARKLTMLVPNSLLMKNAGMSAVMPSFAATDHTRTAPHEHPPPMMMSVLSPATLYTKIPAADMVCALRTCRA